MHHFTISIFSSLWWKGFVAALLFIIIPLLIGKKLNQENRERLGQFFGILFLSIAILFHIYLFYIGKWHIRSSLPLHLCGMSGILAGLVMFWRNQWLFELLLYWGIPGGIHSLLTPVLSNGNDNFLFFEFYLVHAGIILSPLFLIYFLEMQPRKNSWLKIFLLSQFFLLSVGIINWLIGSNYMYVAEKPSVENPLLMGEWPWYILGFEIAGLVHFYLLYLILGWAKVVK